MGKLKLSGVIRESIVDGPGIRFVIFTQGCPHHCKGCHNPDTHDPNGGYETDSEKIIDAIKNTPIISGVTFSGGEPFEQADELSIIAEKVHEFGLNVLTYTGYTMEYILSRLNKNPDWEALLRNSDILIDGPFILKKRSLELRFRGSTNQRILSPIESLKSGCAVKKEL